MSDTLPLSALLSQALVAFIIEFDNEFEHRAPHRTTDQGASGGAHTPWLVSMVMWFSFLRFVPDEGTTVKELLHLTGTDAKTLRLRLTRLAGWWGYIVIESGSTSKKSDALIRFTPGGRKAAEIWRPLAGIIEERWQRRFGNSEIAVLHKSLCEILGRAETRLPHFLPILGYGLFSREATTLTPTTMDEFVTQPLPMLVAKVLLLFAREFESSSNVSLTISANILRLVGENGVALSDLPRLSGVSKEAIAMSSNFLKAKGYASESKSPSSRTKTIKLTAQGRHARESYFSLVASIEKNWEQHFGADTIRALHASLERLVGPPHAPSPLLQGLEPYPKCWRSSLSRPATLPHYPMILHRGGFPDGS